jgi:hypothetical protein
MSIDAMQQALKALEAINEMSKPPMNIPLAAEIDGAMDALRKALTQPEQEPVAWLSSPDFIEQQTVEGRPRRVWFECNTGVGIPLYTAQPSKPWVSLSDRYITGAAHNKARYPVSILETTDSGLCMQFSETGEWHASDKRGDFMKVNSFLMSFARAVEAELRSKNT